MKENQDNNTPTNKKESEKIQTQEKLSQEQKEKLQVQEGQNNHDVDERGGF
ncbi:hypothetical protein [Paenisporosarcina sp. OV554]|uniref:hypothetical protein n=1 Tax=Paenisporosarcina sp. OV554 TaxID=2135694 RepID=UPI000D42FE28|nr:hypothetical protein [Paenisporosarcina sp. OV554]PUB12891.1 hypothetical protein C8K15_1083 [Paenisporosarcina sp. OV554]